MSLAVAAGEALSVRETTRRRQPGAVRRRLKSEEIDRDVQEFCARANTLVPGAEGKRRLSRFAVGMKRLGLWGNLICWPLRRGQRAMNGTAVLSLGGWQSASLTASGGQFQANGFVTATGSAGSLTGTLSGKTGLLNFHLIYASQMAEVGGTKVSVDLGGALGGLKLQQVSGNTGQLRFSDSGNGPALGVADTAHGIFQAGRETIFASGSFVERLYIQRNNSRNSGTSNSNTAMDSDSISFERDLGAGADYAGTTSFLGFLNIARGQTQAHAIETLLRNTLMRELA